MKKIIVIFILFLGSKCVTAQEFVWSKIIGSQKSENYIASGKLDNRIITILTFNDSFFELNRWYKVHPTLGSTYILIHNTAGKLQKVIKVKNDSLRFAQQKLCIHKNILLINQAQIINGTILNKDTFNEQKESWILQLDTFGEIKIFKKIRMKKNNQLIKPQFEFSLMFANDYYVEQYKLYESGLKYFFGGADSFLNNAKNNVLHVKYKLNNAAIINRIQGTNLPIFSLIYNQFDSSYCGIGFISSDSDSFKINNKHFYYSNFHENIIKITFDKNLNILETKRLFGDNFAAEISFSFLSRNSFVCASQWYTSNEKDSIVIQKKKNKICRSGVFLSFYSNHILKFIKLFNSNEFYGNFAQSPKIISNNEFVYLSAQIIGKVALFPDSLNIAGFENDANGVGIKIDTMGNILWYFTAGLKGTSEDFFSPIILENSAVFAGLINGSTVLGKDSLKHIGERDIFLTKITDNSIYRGDIYKGPYCAGDNIVIPFRAYGKYHDTNTFFAEISDENGNFYGSQRVLGYKKTNTSDTIIGSIPLFNVISGGNYRIRIRSNSPFVQSFMRYDSFRLLIYSKDTANPGRDTTICRGQKVTLKTFGGTRWRWSPGMYMSDSTARITTFTALKNTKVRIIISDSSGCGKTDTAYKNVSIFTPLIPIAIDTTICKKDTILLSGKSSGGYGKNINYLWKQNNQIFGTQNLKWHYPQALPTLYASDDCGVSMDTAQAKIKIFSGPTFSYTVDSICATKNHTVTFSAKAGLTPYKYFINNNFSSLKSNLITTKDSVSQKIFVQDNCKTNSDTQVITTYTQPIIKIKTKRIVGCEPFTDTIFATFSTGKINYWKINNQKQNGINNSFILDNKIAGNYVISAINKNYICSDSAIINIRVNPKPTIEFTVREKGLLLQDDKTTATNFSTGLVNVWWYWDKKLISTNKDSTQFILKDTGTFPLLLIGKNGFGCIDSLQKNVKIGSKLILWFPNAVSLNFDGLNDNFGPVGYGIQEFKLQIYDRWGGLVFNGKPNQHWIPDKKTVGQMYIYTCLIQDQSYTWQRKSGTVMVVH